MDDRTFVVFSTVNSEDEAARIATCVVERGLAACVGIVPRLRSIYAWEGKIHDDDECLLLFKTSGRAVDALERAVKEIHPYELPELFALDMDRCDRGYRAWLLEMTGGGAAGARGSGSGGPPPSAASST